MTLPLSTKLSDLNNNHETDSLVDPLCSSPKRRVSLNGLKLYLITGKLTSIAYKCVVVMLTLKLS